MTANVVNGTYSITMPDKTVTVAVSFKRSHDWSTEWSYDETHHWRACGNCEERKDDRDHADRDKNHACDNCSVETGTHADGDDKGHTCDECESAIGTCKDTDKDKDKDHDCDYGCNKVSGTHEADEGNTVLEYVGGTFGYPVFTSINISNRAQNVYKIQRKSLTIAGVFEYHIEDNELFAPSWFWRTV